MIMWVLFVKLLSPAEWWLDPKPGLRTPSHVTIDRQGPVSEPSPRSVAASMVPVRDTR
jgi:hypothetical protein